MTRIAATSSGVTPSVLGTPQLATEEQMQTLRACKTCVETANGLREGSRYEGTDGRIGEPCPTCCQTVPLTGVCDNCS